MHQTATFGLRKTAIAGFIGVTCALVAISGCSQSTDAAAGSSSAAASAPAESTPAASTPAESVPAGSSSMTLPDSCTGENPTVGVSLPNTTNPYYIEMKNGFESAGAKLGFKVVVAVADDDVTNQLSQVDTFIQQGVCALALNPISSGPGATMAANASKAGIPVFTVNVSVDQKQLDSLGGSIVQYIGADQTGGGKLMAEEVLKVLGAEAPVVAGIVGFPAAEVTNQRDSGFSTVLLAGNPNASVAQIVDGKVAPDVSLQVTTEMLQGNPDMNVIFADTGPAAAGALKAINQLGKAKDVTLVAFCAADTPLATPYVACAGQEPADYAKILMENVRQFVDGTKVPAEILRPTPVFVDGQTPPPGIIG